MWLCFLVWLLVIVCSAHPLVHTLQITKYPFWKQTRYCLVSYFKEQFGFASETYFSVHMVLVSTKKCTNACKRGRACGRCLLNLIIMTKWTSWLNNENFVTDYRSWAAGLKNWKCPLIGCVFFWTRNRSIKTTCWCTTAFPKNCVSCDQTFEILPNSETQLTN